MTANDILRRALLLVGAIGEGDTPTATQASDAFSALNVMLSAWGGAEGFLTSQYPSPTTDLDLPDGYERAIIFNLAVEIAPEYGREAPPSVQRLATSSKRALRRGTVELPTLNVDAVRALQWGNNAGYNIINDSFDPSL